MATAALLELTREALLLLLALGAPVVVAALVMGVLTGLLQSVTQIHDAALGFVPRLLAVVAALVIAAPWIAQRLLAFTAAVLDAAGRVG